MADFADTRVSLAGQGALIGVALTVPANNACVVSVSNVVVTARVVLGVTLTLGDAVLIMRQGATYWVMGVAGPAPAVPPAPPPPADGSPNTGDSAPPPKPPTTTGTLTCVPVATATYRDGSWRSDIGPVNSADTFQGRYGGSSFGRNTGCAFYGTKPRSLAGATVTKATIAVRRLTAGDFSARTPTLRLVTQPTRPSGAPTLNETTAGPALKVGASTSAFAIPASWAQDMVDGSRGGLAISISADTPYIQLAGRGSWSAAWTLTISWRRS